MLITAGPPVVISLAALCGLVWLAIYVGLLRGERQLLETEADEVISMIVSPDYVIYSDAYEWSEPHHVIVDRDSDPLFVQVYDADAHLLRASINIIDYPDQPFPNELVAPTGSWASRDLSARRFEFAGVHFSSVARKIETDTGRAVGFVQVLRYQPDDSQLLRYSAMGLVGLFIGFSALLLWFITLSASRILVPLHNITRFADQLSGEYLDKRVEIPESSDYEAAVLASTVNSLLDRVQASVSEVRQFTADAAHEMITPLTILRGHIDVALRRKRSDASYRETLRILESRLDQLVRLVRGLVQLARLDSEKSIEVESVDVAALADTVVEDLADTARSKNLSLKSEIDGRPFISAQTDLIYDAILNLTENAVRYTADGWVRISVSAVRDLVVVRVSDSGSGIPEEALDLVWMRFYRFPLSDSEHPRGSGLGLAIVKKIVERFGGSVSVSSEPGIGSKFDLVFPGIEPEGESEIFPA